MDAKNEIEAIFWQLAPPIAAVLLTILFVALGFWQLDRAAEKVAMQRLFDADADYVTLTEGMAAQEYQRISASGRFLPDRQFLIDNMMLNGRPGYFVITPFEYAGDKPALAVNRGWIAAAPDRSLPELVPLTSEATEIRGRVGRLPRVGIRSGEAIANQTGWPKLAAYPEMAEISTALGRDLLPFVLLLDPDGSDTLVRQWQPQGRGPAMHYGYAFQWFALAAATAAILIWQFLKRRRHDRA